jgi:arylsulfatase
MKKITANLRSLGLALLSLLMICINSGFTNNNPPGNDGKRPNVIIIFMDDMGYGDPECYNGSLYHTPNINQLAAEGMRFTNFYAAQAVCTASRAGLLTGCYPNRLGISGAFFPWTGTALNPKEVTIASMLKKAGYQTGMVGKWHLGAEPPYWPLSYGFDEFTGLPYSNDMWAVNYDGKPITDTSDWKSRYPVLPLIEGNKMVRQINTLDDQAELTGIYTAKACRFIEKNKNKPFFLYLAHSMPHVPIAASKKFNGKSERGLFGDVMMEIDWSVGEILSTLRKQGLEKNTLVVFTSDNGPWLTFGNHAGNSGGLREGKGTSWEGGQKEPCIMRWPGKIPAGTVCSKLGATIDLLPTIAEICHVNKPTEKIDGVSILPLLLNDAKANPRDEFVYYYQRNSLEAIRKANWKLMFPHTSVTYKDKLPGRDGFPGVGASAKWESALYDLSTDPGETVDLSSRFPEVVKALTALADKYRKQLGDDLTKTEGTENRPAATFTPRSKSPASFAKVPAQQKKD